MCSGIDIDGFMVVSPSLPPQGYKKNKQLSTLARNKGDVQRSPKSIFPVSLKLDGVNRRYQNITSLSNIIQ